MLPEQTAVNPPVVGDGIAPSDEVTAPAVESGWTRAEKSYGGGEVLDVRVTGYNRGGLLVDLGDARGFVPASQLSHLPRQLTEEQRQTEMARYIGQTLKLKVIELDRAHNRLILSERIANPVISRVEQALAALQIGQTRQGVIRNVTDFGAFVDLGGVEGLIHVSELAWQHVKHPRDLLAAGQAVDVLIMDVNREQRRVACSRKRLTPNPWTVIAEKLRAGDWVDGAVTSVLEFGAFVRLAEGVEGLIHVSELTVRNAPTREILQEGQAVHVRVLTMDPERQRISLTLRAETPARNAGAADAAMPPPPDAGYWASLAESEP